MATKDDAKKEIEYDLKLFERAKQDTSDKLQESQRKYDLDLGVFLGLLYGILGNLLVQFLAPVLEQWRIGSYNTTFSFDLTMSIIALVLIILLSIAYWWRLRSFKNTVSAMESGLEVFNSAIERKKQQLEKKTKK